MGSKVVVIGLDGFNPDLVERWKDQLPVLTKMMQEGIYGDLESTVPPITPQAWTVAQCGRNPGNFGFWNFNYRKRPVYGEPDLINSEVVYSRVDTLYRIVSTHGKRPALINVPVTFPPQETPKGNMISCFMTPGPDSDFTYPKELKAEITELIGEYIIDASVPGMNFRLMPKEQVLERIYKMDEQRWILLQHYLKEKNFDYIFVVIMGTDRMPHLFYRYFDEEHVRYDPDPKYKDALKNHYIYCDEQIGKIRELLDDNTVLIVHSDHSVQRLDGRINLNEWLVQEGYLKLNVYPNKLTPMRDLDIDWSESKAWATGYTGQIYINLKGREKMGIVPAGEYDSLVEEICQKIKKIPAENGRNLNTQVFKRSEVHSGPYADLGPDIFINFDEARWNISEMVGYQSIYSYDTTLGPDDGGHGQYGYFVMVGPGVAAKGRVKDITLLDIAPTVLKAMGLPIPENMEGKPIE